MKLVHLAFFAVLAVVFASPSLHAQDDQSAIQERMKARVPQIDELKLAGVVGENNTGFLEQRGSLTPEQTQLMNAENADRRALYNILAGRLGLSVAVVGAQRAASLRERSAAGVWLQREDGTWYKK